MIRSETFCLRCQCSIGHSQVEYRGLEVLAQVKRDPVVYFREVYWGGPEVVKRVRRDSAVSLSPGRYDVPDMMEDVRQDSALSLSLDRHNIPEMVEESGRNSGVSLFPAGHELAKTIGGGRRDSGYSSVEGNSRRTSESSAGSFKSIREGWRSPILDPSRSTFGRGSSAMVAVSLGDLGRIPFW